MQRFAQHHLTLALLFLVASGAAAQRSQLDLKVVDMDGKEIGPVNVTLTSPAGEVTQVTTRKNGRIKVRLEPADAPYKVVLQMAGHPDREAEVMINAGRDTSSTLQLWDEAAALQQQAVDAFNDAVRAIQGGDADTALPLFQKAVEIDPTIAAAHRMVAAILHTRRDFEGAAVALDKYMELEQLMPELSSMAFEIFLATGDPRTAEAKQWALDAGQQEDLAPMVFRQGVEAVRADDDERAIELFVEATTLDPGLYQAHRNIGTIHFNRQDFEEALVALDRALELDPRNSEALRMKFFSHAGLGRLDESIEAGKAWLEVNPTAGRQVQHQAEQLFQEEAFGNARLFDQSLIAWDDNHPRAHFRLGVVYRRSADSALAKEHLTRYLSSASENENPADVARAHYELGMLAVNASDEDGASEHLTKYLEMAPDGEFADVARSALGQPGS